MKNLLKTTQKLFFGSLVILLTSCNQSEPVNYAIFSGTITNPNSENLIITDNNNKTIKEIKVAENGTFTDSIFDVNGYYNFYDGKERSSFYLKNGYNLTLNMDAKEFDETIVYTGTDSDVNNFLAQKFMYKEKNTGTAKELYSLDETSYLSKVKELKESLVKQLENLDEDFSKEEKTILEYEYVSQVMNYENAHRYFSKNKDFKVSESYPNPLKDLDLSNETYFQQYSIYKSIVISNFYNNARKKSKEDKISNEEAWISLLETYKSQVIKNDIASSFAMQLPRSANPEILYNGIMKISTDATLKEKVTKQYDVIVKLAKGKPSPIFTNYENHAGGTTSLTDLKGKYVYVDVWATWCQPCKAEIPSLQKLEHEYKDKNIEFVSISIDDKKDYDLWKQMVTDKELSGTQLFADKSWGSEFMKNYAIQSIPRFILLDPEGNIVDSNAPRPSNPGLVALFNELKI